MADPVVNSGVTVARPALSDTRYGILKRVCGLVDHEHAIGKMVRLWNQCTEENTYVLTRDDVEAVLGDKAVEGLVRARLGEEVEGGIRIKGTEGRVEWLGDRRQQASAAGVARARSADRGPDGRMLPRRVASGTSPTPAPLDSAGPAATSPTPAESSPSSPSPSSGSEITHTGDALLAIVERVRRLRWEAEVGLHAELRLNTPKPSPMASAADQQLALRAVQGWIAESRQLDPAADPELLIGARIGHLIVVRSVVAREVGHTRWWTESTFWSLDGIAKDLRRDPKTVAGEVRESRGRDGPPGRSRAPQTPLDRQLARVAALEAEERDRKKDPPP